jgi:hypothetical protein
VRKIDQFNNSIDQGVSQCDERIEDSIAQAGEGDFKKLGGGLYEVDK